MSKNIRLSKVALGINKVQKLLHTSTIAALENKLLEVPRGKAVVLLDQHYRKIDCGKFTVLVPVKAHPR